MQQKYVYIFIYYNNCVDTQSRVLVIKVVALIYKFFFFFTVLHTFFSLLFDPYLYSTIKVTTKLTNMLEAMRRKMKIYQVNKKKYNSEECQYYLFAFYRMQNQRRTSYISSLNSTKTLHNLKVCFKTIKE